MPWEFKASTAISISMSKSLELGVQRTGSRRAVFWAAHMFFPRIALRSRSFMKLLCST